ncbi:MAG: glycosyltransferase family 4 protein [Flavobacteriales bacterium]|nr:glycosyltransferase family 4 protein [Flavobacteriales bacterium]
MKKVLVITYYWPPSGGSGVQRWLKMSGYMPQFGYEPHIYTPENPTFDVRDDSLLDEVNDKVIVIKRKIREPLRVYQAAFRWFGKNAPKQKDLLSERNNSLFQRFSTWVRGNYFIPDPRITWVKPSVRFLTKYIRDNAIDTIISTGPPHSMHLVALALKKKNEQLKWVADFRDPWSEWDIWNKLKTGEKARAKNRELESAVLNIADLVLTISPYHVRRLKFLGAGKVELIPNGYDQKDFEKNNPQRNDKFTVRHLGSVDELRDPRPFIDAALELIKWLSIESNEFVIEFYGEVNEKLLEEMRTHKLLFRYVRFYPPVPHSEVATLYSTSSVLLLVLADTNIAEGNTPGKMYEYMASRKPIIGIGPAKGDAAKILAETKTGVVFERNNSSGITEELSHYYLDWKSGRNTTTEGAIGFTRKQLTKKTCVLLDQLQINNL